MRILCREAFEGIVNRLVSHVITYTVNGLIDNLVNKSPDQEGKMTRKRS